MKRIRAWGTRGTAAIEFAIIAPVFFMFMFGIIETGLVFFSNGVLENGAEVAGRLIRTGQAQGQGMTQDQFRAKICSEISMLLSCDTSRLQLDVRSYSAFSSVTLPSAIKPDGTLDTTLTSYVTGGACDIVVVRAFYVWKLFTPVFSRYFANMSNNERMISIAVAFRNEPYGSTGC